jgi:hypothetical protein
MLVAKHISEVFNEFVVLASEDCMSALESEMVSLLTWGERRNADVVDVDREKVVANRVIDHDGKPMEVECYLIAWNLEGANKAILPDLDARVLVAYRQLKKAGTERPSLVLAQAFFPFILQKKFDEKWANSYMAWVGVNLVLNRLQSNARIVCRYEFPDKFGPKMSFHEDGSVDFAYGKKPWTREMKRRGMVGGKNGG